MLPIHKSEHWVCCTACLTPSLTGSNTQSTEPTMRSIYRVLARQYDPLGLFIPYTTRAKILMQRLWDKKRDWDDPQLPEDILQLWHTWESELSELPSISLPWCYVQRETDVTTSTQAIHIFSDASERAYGYLQTVGQSGNIQVAFLAAQVTPVRHLSIPKLEPLCCPFWCPAGCSPEEGAHTDHHQTYVLD